MPGRLAASRKIVQDLRELTDVVGLMLSAGKDSVVCLDLLREKFDGEQIVCMFRYQAVGLRLVEAPLEALARRYDVTVLKSPDPVTVENRYYGVMQPQGNAAKISYTDVDEWLREQGQLRWIVTGERKMDSLHRRGMITSGGVIDHRRQRCYPLAEWNNTDVMTYVQAKNIPLAPHLGTSVRMGGVGTAPEVLDDLERRYPSDWDAYCQMYPLAPAALGSARLRWREQEKLDRADGDDAE